MNLLGIQLQLMMGPTIAVPVPRRVAEALERVEVTRSDEGRSGFQLTFRVDHSGPLGLIGGFLLDSPLLTVFNRVVLTVILRGTPRVLMDGFITSQEHQPTDVPGVSALTLTGEDISLMMDKDEKNVEHPAQDEMTIALKIIASYAQFGLIPLVVPPALFDPPLPVERTPVQQCTDMEYLQHLAERHAYVFYITPGPARLTNTAYWGPPIRVGQPQKALSVNMGPHTNVESVDFQHNALAATSVSGRVQDRITNLVLPIQSLLSLRPPLAAFPDLQVHRQQVRRRLLRKAALTTTQALARAQAQTDRSTDEVVTATGELDAMRYGELLQPRALVGLRGAGHLYDGFYYVKRVTHSLSRGSYKQSFTLAREGLGTTTSVVRP